MVTGQSLRDNYTHEVDITPLFPQGNPKGSHRAESLFPRSLLR